MRVIIVRSRTIDSAVFKVAETLSKNGYDVCLLAWDRQRNFIRNQNDTYRTVCFNLKAPYDKYPALFYVPFWWVYVILFLLKNKCDVIHACDLDCLIPAVPLKLLKKTKLFYTIYDFYANNLPDGRFKLFRRSARKMIAGIEKFGIGFTESLFLVDECRYEEVAGARIRRVTYIYNTPDDYVAPGKYIPKVNRDSLDILYVGILVKARGLDHMIRALDGLKDVRLVIGGVGPQKEFVEEAARKCSNVQYLGWLNSYSEVIQRTAEADIIFRFSDPILPKTKYESPNKLFEAMMCSKPIIVTDGSSMANIVKTENCGLVVTYGSVNEVRDAIRKLKDNPQLRRQLGENGRKAYEEKYSWKIMEKRIIEAYGTRGKDN